MEVQSGLYSNLQKGVKPLAKVKLEMDIKLGFPKGTCIQIVRYLIAKQLLSSKSIDKLDWKEVDQNLAHRVKMVSSQLINSNPSTRVARYSIMGALTKRERGRIKTYIRHLPKTDQALNECAETKEEYQIRHLPALVQQLRTHYNYEKVTIDTIMSYRRSYRGISDDMKEILRVKLIDID